MLAAILKRQNATLIARSTMQAAPMLSAGLSRRAFSMTKYQFEDEDYDKNKWQVSAAIL